MLVVHWFVTLLSTHAARPINSTIQTRPAERENFDAAQLDRDNHVQVHKDLLSLLGRVARTLRLR